jgi:hypothetical protein
MSTAEEKQEERAQPCFGNPAWQDNNNHRLLQQLKRLEANNKRLLEDLLAERLSARQASQRSVAGPWHRSEEAKDED